MSRLCRALCKHGSVVTEEYFTTKKNKLPAKMIPVQNQKCSESVSICKTTKVSEKLLLIRGQTWSWPLAHHLLRSISLLCSGLVWILKQYPVKVEPPQTHSSASISKDGFHSLCCRWLFTHVQRRRLRDCVAWQRSSDSISLIESALRLSSTGCLGDSLLEAGRGAASSPAYMKPLEVNFLIKSPQPPPPPPHLPLYCMDACNLIFVCAIYTLRVCLCKLIYNANMSIFK